jgi:hypothetical protein
MKFVETSIKVQIIDPNNNTIVREFITTDWKEANNKFKDWKKRFPKNPIRITN